MTAAPGISAAAFAAKWRDNARREHASSLTCTSVLFDLHICIRHGLDESRRRWLNPPELVREEPDVAPSLPPVDEEAERQLKRPTLTNLYNERPAWLANLHRDLDAAVFAPYGWEEADAQDELGEEELLSRLLALNLERAEP